MDFALQQLCTRPQTFLGFVAMLLLILSFIFYVSHEANNRFFRPKTAAKSKKRPILWILSVLSLILALAFIAIYIITPALIGWVNPDAAYTVSGCGGSVPPYCGEYCRNSSIAPAYDDCTCIMY